MSHRRWILRAKLFCFVSAIFVLVICSNSTDVKFIQCLAASWTEGDSVQSSHMFVYLFNWTNMYDPVNMHVKPNFVQLGPYVFRAINHTSTSGTRMWQFEKQISIGALDELVFVFHPSDPVVANRIRSWNQHMKKLINFSLNGKAGCLGLDKEANKWIFEGSYDPLTDVAKFLDTELIPWYFRQFEEFENFNGSEAFMYGACLDGAAEMETNCTKIENENERDIFSDDEILKIFSSIHEYYVPFAITTERVEISQTLVLLQKLIDYWLDSYCLVFGTFTILVLIGVRFLKDTKQRIS